MKKYDRIFVPVDGTQIADCITIRNGKYIFIEEQTNVIVLAEDEYNRMKSDCLTILKSLGELN